MEVAYTAYIMYLLADRSTILLTGWPSATEEKKEYVCTSDFEFWRTI